MPATSLQKWGNSQVIRIPKEVLDTLGWQNGKKLLLSIEEDKLIIRPVKKKIEILFENYHDDYEPAEIDWGEPAGKEIW